MNIFYFTHFYTTSADQSIKQVQDQCSRIGNNPLFLIKECSICGYILPQEALAVEDASTSVMSIKKSCPTVKRNSREQDSGIRLLTEQGEVVAWTFGDNELPRYTAQPIDSQQIEAFGNFAKWITKIAQTAEHEGCRVFLVGGVVRDFVMQRPIRDVDFLVQGDVFPLVEELHQKYGGLLHKEQLFEAAHWTAPDGCRFDFTVARREWYPAPAAIPSTQKGTILDDIMRRDFSANSLLMSVHNSGLDSIIDATDGIQDIQNQSLRILHRNSFRDDPTRIFRGARYAGRYRFFPSDETKQAIQTCLSNLYIDALPYEQVGKEIQKIFTEERPNSAWSLLHKWNVLPHLFGGKTIQITDALHAWNNIHEKGLSPMADRSVLLWLTLIAQIPNQERYHSLTNIVKGGGKLWSIVVPKLLRAEQELSRAKNNGDIGSILHTLSPESLIYLFGSYPNSISWWLTSGRTCKTVVDGAWLLKEGCPRGPFIGEAMRKAQYAAWMGYAHEEQRKIAKNVWTQ